MKNFDRLSLFLGCCVISLGIIIAGYLIADKLPPFISGSFSGTVTEDSQSFREYMSEYEASAFLMMNTEDFIAFIGSGELDGTYTLVQNNYVFSKEKLTQWINNRIEQQ